MSQFSITVGFPESERAAIIALLREYEATLGISLCFQNIDAEIAALPQPYAPPHGAFLLARRPPSPELVACVALRAVPDAPGLCEMKRLFVRPHAQGFGLGRRLALAIMAEARRIGYARICLDTLPTLKAAQALYLSLGFTRTGEAGTSPRVVLYERSLEP